jgi:uncharacterized iron-regulated membrane protein
VRDPEAAGPGGFVTGWLRPLHSGDGLGLVWRILVFLSGFLPALFAITGVSMWLLKRRNRRQAAQWVTAALAAAAAVTPQTPDARAAE